MSRDGKLGSSSQQVRAFTGWGIGRGSRCWLAVRNCVSSSKVLVKKFMEEVTADAIL